MNVLLVIRLGFIFSVSALAVSIFSYGWLSWLNLMIAVNLVVSGVIHFKSSSFFKTLLAHSGTAAPNSRDIESFTKMQLERARESSLELRSALAGVEHIGQDTFNDFMGGLKDEEIKNSLLMTHEKIVVIRQKEKESNWVTQGVAAVSGIKHRGNDLAEFAHLVVSDVIKYLGANQGGFFILENNDEDEHFSLVASYAYDKRKYMQKRINLGEGMIGQMYYEKDIVLLTDIPADYVKITSGLGESLPTCICLVPLLSAGRIHGVLEFASFRKFNAFEVEYLKQIGENVGYNLSAIETSRSTENLLKDSQKMAEEVKAQEEELRQNIEELKSTQETMVRERSKLETLSLVADSTNNSVIITDREGHITYTNEGFTKITGYTFDEISGRKPGSFLQGPLTDRTAIARISSQLKSGDALYEEVLNYRKNGELYWVSLVINPVKNAQGQIEKYISVQADITETKRISLDFQAKLKSISKTNVIIEFNAQGQILEVNEFFSRIMEFSDTDIIGKLYTVLIPSEDQAKPQTQLMWQSIFAGQSFTGEFKLADKLGRIQWLSGSYNPVVNINGDLERVLMLGQFVTADKEKVGELHRVIESIDACIPIVEIKADMTFRAANKMFLSSTGLKRLEFKRLTPVSVFGEASSEAIEKFIKDTNMVSLEMPLVVCTDGETRLCYNATLFKLNEIQDANAKILVVLKKG